MFMRSQHSNKQQIYQQHLNRRRFLKLGLITIISGLTPYRAMAAVEDFLSAERALSLYNPHTKEYIETVYWENGDYIPEALNDINNIFRDHYNGAVNPIDIKLLDLLCVMHKQLNYSEPFYLISGYRTPETNAFLMKHKNGVSKNSFHMYGKAADIRLPGYDIKMLRRAAYELKAGGVGYYPRLKFVHIDVGKVRYW